MPPLASRDTAAMKTKEPASGMLEKLKRLHDDGAESDFTFVVGARQFKVHKLVLHLNSSVLYAMANKGTRAELKDVDPDHFAAMIKYMYHQTYDESVLTSALKRLEDAMDMNAIANKFQVTEMIAEMEERFKDTKLYYTDPRTPKGLAEMIDKAYGNANISKKMRELVMERVCDHIGVLAGQDKGPLNGILLRKPKLAIELLRFMDSRKSADKIPTLGHKKLFQHCTTIIAVSYRKWQGYGVTEEDDLPPDPFFACPDCRERLDVETWELYEVK